MSQAGSYTQDKDTGEVTLVHRTEPTAAREEPRQPGESPHRAPGEKAPEGAAVPPAAVPPSPPAATPTEAPAEPTPPAGKAVRNK